MRRAVVGIMIAVMAAMVAGSSRTTYDARTYRGGSGGVSAGVRVSVSLPENGGLPTINVVASAPPAEIRVAASASLSNRFPWHGNGEAWAIATEDTSEGPAYADPHRLSSLAYLTDWVAWEGDTVRVHVRLWDATAAVVIFDTLATKILDAPGVLTTVAWYSELGWLDCAVRDGYLPALADSDKVFDKMLIGSTDGTKTNFRYAYFKQDTPTVCYSPAGYYSSATRDVNDGSYAANSHQSIHWYNLAFIPTDAEILLSKHFLTSNGNAVTLAAGQYLTMRLDTLASDAHWIDAPQRAYDKRQRGTAWNEPDTTQAGNWDPILTARDDGFDWGPRAGKGPVAKAYASDSTMVLSTKEADQAYLDMGAGRVNAGYWLIRRSAVSAAHGFVYDCGPGAAANSQPVKVMQYVTGSGRVLPWGIGSHRVPIAFVADDSYDEQAGWIEDWGAADFTMAINGAWVDGLFAAKDGHMTAAEIGALWESGVDIAPHGVQHGVPLGAIAGADSSYTYGTRRDWYQDVIDLADTTDVELADLVWWGGIGIDARLLNVKFLLANNYRSALGYTGTTVEGRLGSLVDLSWNHYINAFHINRYGASNIEPASLADAKEKIGRLIDDAHDDYLAPVILWAHDTTELPAQEMEYIAQAVQANPAAVQMTLEELVTLRLNGQTPIAPSHTPAENTYMPAAAGIDSVWARQETWLHNVWYPPFGDRQ